METTGDNQRSPKYLRMQEQAAGKKYLNVRVLTTAGDIRSRTEAYGRGPLSDFAWTVANQIKPEGSRIARIEAHGEPVPDSPAESSRSGCIYTAAPLNPKDEADAWRKAGLTYEATYLPSSKMAPV